jgi:hypothetical protein
MQVEKIEFTFFKKSFITLYGFGIEEDIKASNRMCAKKYFEECHSNLSKDCI